MLEIGRRGFITGLSTIAAVMLVSPTLVHAESIYPDGWIKPPRDENGWYSRDDVWTSPNWSPIFERRAFTSGLPRVHDTYWGAWVLDRAREELLNLPNLSTDLIQQQATHKADVITATRPETESSAGYCPWLAVAQLVETKPVAFLGEDLMGQTDPEKIVQLREQALEIYHAGSRLVRMVLQPETLLTIFTKGFPVVVDARLGMEGNWFRSVAGIRKDGRKLLATNFGSENIPLELRQINFAYIAYPADSPNSLYTPQINQDTAFWRYQKVDRSLVNRILTPNVAIV